MKCFMFLLVLLLVFAVQNANGQGWEWAKNAWTSGSSGSTVGTSVAIDSWGHVYVTGNCDTPIAIFGTTVLTGARMFLAKYDTVGNVLWVKGAFGTGGTTSVATDGFGNVYVTGCFSSLIFTIGTITLVRTNPALPSVDNIFLIKYDSSGNVL